MTTLRSMNLGTPVAMLLLVHGCASVGAPASERAPNDRGDRPCTLLGIEEVHAEADHNDDAVQLVATYRFDGSARTPPRQPLSLGFRVVRSRVNELREHLETQPAVLCAPEGEPDAALRVCVPPFEGQRGEPAP